MLKFKVGDVVKIKRNTCYHGFDIGSYVTIKNIIDWENGHYSYESSGDDGHMWVFVDDDCEAI